MQRIFFIAVILFLLTQNLSAQSAYDSVTISGSRIEQKWYGAKWSDTLRLGKYANYIFRERTVWKKTGNRLKTSPDIITLSAAIKTNGTDDVAKCFIPRHSVNFYKEGKIIRYLLVCFECEGVRFSDDPAVLFIKKETTRLKQLKELRKLFTPLL